MPRISTISHLRNLSQAAVLCVLLSGCSQWYYTLGEPLSEAQTPALETTPSVTEVMRELGPPLRLSATADGYVMAWEHWRISEDAIGVSLGALGADMLSVDWGAARMHSEFIVANFDHQHRLTGASFSSWTSAAGSSQALQPLVGISLVELDDLLETMPNHRWGALNLQRLPAALNRQSQPDTGQAGMEQRGTPRNIGQRALEMN